jgi:hypothetical protein
MSSFEEKELAILRSAVDKAEERSGRKLLHSEDVQKIIRLVENFIRKNKLVCYGGTAINNILPSDEQFYNKDSEIPDYDFFSPKALYHAKELADLYIKEGYNDVEAKSGVHHGTFKVFVNFIPVADITSLPADLFKTIQQSGISVNGIKYAPPDYLRMAMYLELSRPKGDVSRWEKVLKRLVLLNKNYPMMNPLCDNIEFMRSFEGNIKDATAVYNIIKDSAIDQGLVFFGGFASKMYSRYMPAKYKDKLNNTNPDFDILSDDPQTSATIIKERLQDEGFSNIKLIKRKGVGEIISPHYEIIVGKDTVAFIYKPLACHSYNVIRIKGKKVKIATIDTMLSFYLAFLYANRPYYDHERIYCMSQYLFLVQSKNRLAQKGVLKRFSLQCIGTQETLSDMRNEKNKKYEELKHRRDSTEYNEWFLRYTPNRMNRRHTAKKIKKPRRKSIKSPNIIEKYKNNMNLIM